MIRTTTPDSVTCTRGAGIGISDVTGSVGVEGTGATMRTSVGADGALAGRSDSCRSVALGLTVAFLAGTGRGGQGVT
jgi:hypothetical protein